MGRKYGGVPQVSDQNVKNVKNVHQKAVKPVSKTKGVNFFLIPLFSFFPGTYGKLFNTKSWKIFLSFLILPCSICLLLCFLFLVTVERPICNKMVSDVPYFEYKDSRLLMDKPYVNMRRGVKVDTSIDNIPEDMVVEFYESVKDADRDGKILRSGIMFFGHASLGWITIKQDGQQVPVILSYDEFEPYVSKLLHLGKGFSISSDSFADEITKIFMRILSFLIIIAFVALLLMSYVLSGILAILVHVFFFRDLGASLFEFVFRQYLDSDALLVNFDCSFGECYKICHLAFFPLLIVYGLLSFLGGILQLILSCIFYIVFVRFAFKSVESVQID